MKLAVFGGTGRTGRLLINQALERGYEIRALTRSVENADISHKNLQYIVGNAGKYQDVLEIIRGCSAIISTMAPTSNKGNPKFVKAAENLIKAAQEEGIERIIVTAGAGVSFEKDDLGLLNKLIGFFLKLFSGKVLEDSKSYVNTITSSFLDWTVIRVPMLNNSKLNIDYRIGYIGEDIGFRVSRSTLAYCLLEELEQSKHIHSAPVISD